MLKWGQPTYGAEPFGGYRKGKKLLTQKEPTADHRGTDVDENKKIRSE